MKLYTYYDSGKADYHGSGGGGCYFTKLDDAKKSAAETTYEGDTIHVDLVDTGRVSRELVVRLVNGRSFVRNRVLACVVPGTKSR